jgi:FkbM family methyltransferase
MRAGRAARPMPDPGRIARRVRNLGRRILSRSAAAPPTPTLLGLNQLGDLPRAEMEEASRRSASPVYLGDHVALCRILSRYKFYVDTRDVTFGAHVLLDGFWEPWLTRFVARNVRPGAVVADVGANFGYYSLLLADLVGPEGRVWSVEPNPAAIAMLRRSVLLNGFAGRTTICEAAAGQGEAERATLWVPDGRPGGATLVDPERSTPPDCTRVEVPAVALDSLLAAEERIDFIKIDAEGSEERILAGMAGLLARHRPTIVLEFNAGWYADPRAFLDRLAAVYGSIRHVGYDGEAEPVALDRLLAEPVEWLLCLSPE